MQSQINNEYLCVANNQVPCVRLLNIKIIDGYDTQRHLDTILIQCIPRVGPINRIYVCNNPRFAQAQHNRSTLAHVELVDHNKHEELRSMLSGYYFHDLQWTVSLAFHLFHGLDTLYRPLAHSCTACSRFSQDLYDFEHRRAYTDNERIPPTPAYHFQIPSKIQNSSSESDDQYESIKVPQPITPPTIKVVDDLIDLRAATPISALNGMINIEIEIFQQTALAPRIERTVESQIEQTRLDSRLGLNSDEDGNA